MSEWSSGPLRVALCSGLLVRHDAISNSLQLKLDLLRRLRASGLPVEVTAFVRATDDHADDVVVVADVSEMVRHPRFAAADVHVFEFGIYYDLFNAVFLLGDPNRVIAIYHNITPLELVEDPGIRESIIRSHQQKHNLVWAGHIACDSEWNRDDLLDFGVPGDRLSVLHLPPARPTVPRRAAHAGAPVELLFLGRLVRSKGITDLLAAYDLLTDAGLDDFRLSVVGSTTFSDPAVLADLEAHAARSARIEVLGEIDDDAVARVMSRTDVFVMPSYHEGYCVPVMEAYQAGCQVVAYDSANLPNVVGALGQQVPCGDVVALAAALRRAVEQTAAARRGEGPDAIVTSGGLVATTAWRAAVATHVAADSLEVYEARFLGLLAQAAGARPEPVGAHP